MGPKAMWQLGVGLFLALALAGLIGLSEEAGAEAPVMVVLTASEQAYRVGATAQVELHIFKGEAPVNADDVTLEVGPWGEVREVEMSRASTGLYRATFTILEQDVEKPEYQIPIEVQVVVGGDSYARYLSPAVRIPERISLSFQPQQPLPGDEVTITLRGLKEEKPAQVEGLELKVREGYLGSSTPLSVEGLTTGVYQAILQVPAELKQTTFYLVEASGKVGNRDLEARRGLPVVLHHLWYREVVLTDTLAMMDLWVLDAAGTPVAGAQVRGQITLNEWEANEQVVAVDTQTDSNGVARLTAGYSQGRSLDLEVQVSQGDLTTEFDYSTTIGDRALFTSGLELDTEEVEELRPGQQVKATLRLWSEGEPLPNGDLYYTLASDTLLVSLGRRTTNQEGRFELLFTVPDDLRDQLELKVYPAQAQGAYSSSASTYLPPVIGSDLGLKATGFTPGGWAQITSQPNNPIEEAYLSVVSIDPQIESSPWVYQGVAYFGNALLVQGAEGLKARLPIPPGFSAEQGYVITAYGLQGGAVSTEMVTVNLDEGRPGSGGPGGLLKVFQGEFGGLPLWLWLSFGTGGFATALGIVRTKRRRKDRPVKERPAPATPPPPTQPPDRPAGPSLGGAEAPPSEAPPSTSLPAPAPAPAPLPQAPPGLTPQPKPPAVPPPPPGASPHPPPASKGQGPSQGGIPPPPPPTPVAMRGGPQRVTIECPQCRARMEVPKLNRPQKVRCGACGLEGRAEI